MPYNTRKMNVDGWKMYLKDLGDLQKQKFKIAEVNREIRIERFSKMVPYLLLFEFC